MSLKAKSVTFTVVVLLALAGLFSGIFVGQHVHFKKKLMCRIFMAPTLKIHDRLIDSV